MDFYWIADLVFVLIGVLIIWRCAYNGFIKCLFKFVRTALALVLAYFLVAPVAPVIAENFIEEPVYDLVFEKIDGIYSDAEESIDMESVVDKLPGFLVNEDTEEKLNELDSTGDELVVAVSEEITAPIVKIISCVLAFVISFILLFIVLSIILALLNSLICKIKLINTVNTVLGLIWGLVIAVILWTVVSSLMKGLFGGFDIYDSTIIIQFVGDLNLFEKLGVGELLANLLTSIF